MTHSSVLDLILERSLTYPWNCSLSQSTRLVALCLAVEETQQWVLERYPLYRRVSPFTYSCLASSHKSHWRPLNQAACTIPTYDWWPPCSGKGLSDPPFRSALRTSRTYRTRSCKRALEMSEHCVYTEFETGNACFMTIASPGSSVASHLIEPFL